MAAQETDREPNDARAASRGDRHTDEAMELIRQALLGLRFGEVAVIVQDGVVVQVQRTERRKLHRHER